MPSQFQTPKFPTIPVPTTDTKALMATCLALKRSMEMLTKTDSKSRDGSSSDRYAQHTFVQDTQPVALHRGDLWVVINPKVSLSYWDDVDAKWQIIYQAP